jgi:hypothetical protein
MDSLFARILGPSVAGVSEISAKDDVSSVFFLRATEPLCLHKHNGPLFTQFCLLLRSNENKSRSRRAD